MNWCVFVCLICLVYLHLLSTHMYIQHYGIIYFRIYVSIPLCGMYVHMYSTVLRTYVYT